MKSGVSRVSSARRAVAADVQHPGGQRDRPHRHEVLPEVDADVRHLQVAECRRDLHTEALAEHRAGRAERRRVAHEGAADVEQPQ